MKTTTVELVDVLLKCLAAGGPRLEAAEVAHWSLEDWQKLLEMARRSAVLPLLHARLYDHPLARGLPGAVQEALREQARQAAKLDTQQMGEQMLLLRALAEERLPILLLKGAHLRIAVYESPAARPMSNLDLLVRETDLAQVKEVMTEQGYQRSSDDSAGEGVGCYTYTAPERCLPVVVHWLLHGSNTFHPVDTLGIWQRARLMELSGTTAVGMADEDLLLHLCLHTGSGYLFSQLPLRSLVDISETLRRRGPRMEWAAILQRAHAWRMSHALHMSLQLAHALLDAPLPLAVSDQPVDDQMRSLLDFALGQVRAQIQGVPATDAARWARWEALFPARAQLAALYGVRTDAWYLPFLYLARPFDLARRWVGRGVGLMTGETQAQAALEQARRYEELRVYLRENEPKKLATELTAELTTDG